MANDANLELCEKILQPQNCLISVGFVVCNPRDKILIEKSRILQQPDSGYTRIVLASCYLPFQVCPKCYMLAQNTCQAEFDTLVSKRMPTIPLCIFGGVRTIQVSLLFAYRRGISHLFRAVRS